MGIAKKKQRKKEGKEGEPGNENNGVKNRTKEEQQQQQQQQQVLEGEDLNRSKTQNAKDNADVDHEGNDENCNHQV